MEVLTNKKLFSIPDKRVLLAKKAIRDIPSKHLRGNLERKRLKRQLDNWHKVFKLFQAG